MSEFQLGLLIVVLLLVIYVITFLIWRRKDESTWENIKRRPLPWLIAGSVVALSAALSLEAILIFCNKFVKIVKQHPVEHSPLRMTLTVYPCHGSRDDSRNGPE